jgi:hypothetical protein
VNSFLRNIYTLWIIADWYGCQSDRTYIGSGSSVEEDQQWDTGPNQSLIVNGLFLPMP